MSLLSAIFEGMPDDHWLSVFSTPSKSVQWFQDPAEIEALDFPRDQHSYYSLGTASKNHGPHNRCPESEITGIGALWADFDIIGIGHKSKKYPADIQQVHELFNVIGLEPSAVVSTGGGIHAYWLLDEFFEIEGDADRAAAKNAVETLQRSLQVIAKSRWGWTLDSTFDLARVLRIPGSWNCKHNPPLQAKLDKLDDSLRYSMADIMDRLELFGINLTESTPDRQAIASVDISHADFPHEKFRLLCEVSEEFQDSWDNNRPEWDDQSGSSYDFSLAGYAARAEWSDSEIYALLIEHRKRHGHKPKRSDYYRVTIGKIRAELQERESEFESDELLGNHHNPTTTEPAERNPMPSAGTLVAGPPKPEDKGALETASKRLGIKVLAFEKHGIHEPVYTLKLEWEGQPHAVQLGASQTVHSQSNLARKIWDVIGIMPKIMNAKKWREFILAISEAMTVYEHDTDPLTIILQYVEDYTTGRIYARDYAIFKGFPFEHGDRLYLSANDFRRYLQFGELKNINRNQLREWLIRAGFTHTKERGRMENHDGETQRVQRWYFSIERHIMARILTGETEQTDQIYGS